MAALERTLLLLRHASAASPSGVPDVERPLSEAGRVEARDVGLALAGVAVDLVLCSTALRARETAEALDVAAEVWVERDLYLADRETLLARIGQVDDAVRSLLVVAHNPGLQGLGHVLVADPRDGERVAAHFPPAALAVLAVPVPWSRLAARSARLVSVQHPA